MAKDKKRKIYSAEFNGLVSSPELARYLEPERKLDAGNEGTLIAFEKHIRRSRYYVPLNHPSTTQHDIPAGIHVTVDDINHQKVKPAIEDTPRRWRVYYDTASLDAFHGGVEVRIEHPKPTEHGHAKPYKQVIKLGLPATADDPTFHRIEISGRLTKPIPSFDSNVLDGNKQLESFLKRYFDPKEFLPLQLLTTARERIWCRPGGNPNNIVEFGIDRGRAMTVTRFRYPILQIEPEVLRGDEAVLEEIGQRLTDRFGQQLVANFNSKPTPGFNHLAAVLEDNPEGVAYLRSLPRDQFQMVTPEECPALHPAAKAEPKRSFSPQRVLVAG